MSSISRVTRSSATREFGEDGDGVGGAEAGGSGGEQGAGVGEGADAAAGLECDGTGDAGASISARLAAVEQRPLGKPMTVPMRRPVPADSRAAKATLLG